MKEKNYPHLSRFVKQSSTNVPNTPVTSYPQKNSWNPSSKPSKKNYPGKKFAHFIENLYLCIVIAET